MMSTLPPYSSCVHISTYEPQGKTERNIWNEETGEGGGVAICHDGWSPGCWFLHLDLFDPVIKSRFSITRYIILSNYNPVITF